MILQSYHTIKSTELAAQREASDDPIAQWRRPGRDTFQDSEHIIGWRGVTAATVRAIDLHYRVHRLARFELTLVDQTTTHWCGYGGPPQARATSDALYDVDVQLTSFPQ